MKKLMKKLNAFRSPPARFLEECLKVHNKYRAIHGSPYLVLDEEITSYAQEWSDSLARRDVLEARLDCKYGENLFTAIETNPGWVVQPSDPVTAWYSEIELYTFEKDAMFKEAETGRFTQIIWKDTLRLGVGISSDPESSRVYVVCDYYPRGNTRGQFAENVLPPVKVAKHKNTVVYIHL